MMIGCDLGPELLCNWTSDMLKGQRKFHSHNSTIVRTSVGGKHIPFRGKRKKNREINMYSDITLITHVSACQQHEASSCSF